MMNNTVIGILAHVDAGKTTLSESLLYESGQISKPGRVDNQDAFLDTYDLEKKRGITIFSKQARLSLSGRPVTLVDTPGHADFSAEMERTLQILDYAILVISGADGVQGHTRTLWKLLSQYQVPAFLFINKMDQPGTDKESLMEDIRRSLGDDCIDFTSYSQGGDCRELFDRLAMCDEQAMEYFLENDFIDDSQIRDLIAGRKAFPCFFGSALKMTGVHEFASALAALMKEPENKAEFGARVYKIARDEAGKRLTFLKVTGGSLKVRGLLGEEKVSEIRLYSGDRYETVQEAAQGQIAAVLGPAGTRAGQGFGCEGSGLLPLLESVLTYNIELPPGTDIHKALIQLRQLEEEDPQLHIVWDENAGQIHVQLMGEIQTQVLAQLIADRFGLEVHFGEGKILYKETIRDSVEGVGHFEPLRHYAEVHLRLEPAEPGSGLTFSTECSLNMLDRNWQNLILTHLREKMHRGVLTGSPITDMNIVLIAGRAHEKHTGGGDFREATYRAVRQGLMKARSVILEPWYNFTLQLPNAQIGRAMADIERFSGKFSLEESGDEFSVLTGQAPVSEMRGYQTDVASYTGGRGRLSCSLAGYFPCHDPQTVWEQADYDPESDLANTPDSVFCSHGAGFVVPWYAVEHYMHLPGAGLPDYSGMTGQDLSWYDSVPEADGGQGELEEGNLYSDRLAKGRNKKTDGQMPAGEDELKAIFERTYGPVKSRLHDTSTVIRAAAPKEYVWKEKTNKKKKEGNFLLVDGYNIIFSWEDLADLARHDMGAARDKLKDILSDYQGTTGLHIILVFDAYRVQGFPGQSGRWHNIDVVFTREAETADQYIEKTANVMGRRYNVTVATSDGTEQVIIRSEGCALLSARDLKADIEHASRWLHEEHLDRESRTGNYLGDYMPKIDP